MRAVPGPGRRAPCPYPHFPNFSFSVSREAEETEGGRPGVTSPNPSSKEPQNGTPDGRRIQARRQNLAYQGAFEATVAILICAGFGYWLDGRFDTSPLWLLVGVALGFASFVLRLLRLGRQLQDLRDAEADPAADERDHPTP